MKNTILWLQIWGGVFYLLNKIFFSFKERSMGEKYRYWSIWAWVVYIIGLPAWLIILGKENDWMVVYVEAGGAPSMFLGLVLAVQSKTDCPTINQKRLQWSLDMFARIAAVVGICVSVYHVGWFQKESQWAELGVSIGFLVGTYRLAKNHLDGYIPWFFLMNFSAGALVFMQGYKLLAIQQVLSLCFVFDAYNMKARKMNAHGSGVRT